MKKSALKKTKNNADNSRPLRKTNIILHNVLADCKTWGRLFKNFSEIFAEFYSSSAAGRLDLNQAFHLAIALSR